MTYSICIFKARKAARAHLLLWLAKRNPMLLQKFEANQTVGLWEKLYFHLKYRLKGAQNPWKCECHLFKLKQAIKVRKTFAWRYCRAGQNVYGQNELFTLIKESSTTVWFPNGLNFTSMVLVTSGILLRILNLKSQDRMNIQ